MDMQLDNDHRDAAYPDEAVPRQHGAGAEDAISWPEPKAGRCREPVFDIADFEAIAAFAGLRPMPARAG